MKNVEVATNFIFLKKLQTNVARIWFVKLKQYMMFESFFFLIVDMSISKAYAVEFVMSLASLKVN